MTKLNELEKYNEWIFTELSKSCEHFQVGFFNPNAILFIGQNPGMPFTEEQHKDLLHLREHKTYREHEEAYTESWKRSLFGSVIEKIVNGDWSKISFTNYVKVPTPNNTPPDESLILEFVPIILRQIYLSEPKLIVCLGKFVGKQFNIEESYKLVQWYGVPIIMFPHPAYIQRQGEQYMNNEIRRMKSVLGFIS